MAVRASCRPKPSRCPAPAVPAPSQPNRSGSTQRDVSERTPSLEKARLSSTAPRPKPSTATAKHRSRSIRWPQPSAGVWSRGAERCSTVGSGSSAFCNRQHMAVRDLAQPKPDGRQGSKARQLGRRGQSQPGPTCCCTCQPAPFATNRASSPARIAAYTTVPAPKSHRVGAALGSSTFNTLPAQPQTSELLFHSFMVPRKK